MIENAGIFQNPSGSTKPSNQRMTITHWDILPKWRWRREYSFVASGVVPRIDKSRARNGCWFLTVHIAKPIEYDFYS